MSMEEIRRANEREDRLWKKKERRNKAADARWRKTKAQAKRSGLTLLPLRLVVPVSRNKKLGYDVRFERSTEIKNAVMKAFADGTKGIDGATLVAYRQDLLHRGPCPVKLHQWHHEEDPLTLFEVLWYVKS